MNKKIFPATIQLKQNNNKILQGINQFDTGVILDVRIMDGLVPFNFEGYGLVTLKIIKPDKTIYVDSDSGSHVDTLNASEGRFKVGLPASLTAQKGMHFCWIGFGEGTDTYFETTTFNYCVGDDQFGSDESIEGSDEYPLLLNLIAQFADMQTKEEARELAEADRQSNEIARQQAFNALLGDLAEAIAKAEQAEQWYNVIVGAIKDAVEAAGGTLNIDVDYDDLVTDAELSDILDDYASKTYVDDALEDLGLPEIVIQTSAPSDTSKIWIDTSIADAPVLKYYNGTTWKSANVAVFA